MLESGLSMVKLKDAVAIVTGGAGGIGNCICQRLFDDGAKVVVADINLNRAIDVAKKNGS